ncbi:MAG: hypothetical protein ACOYKZ_00170 [Chlamydiia bacterium]
MQAWSSLHTAPLVFLLALGLWRPTRAILSLTAVPPQISLAIAFPGWTPPGVGPSSTQIYYTSTETAAASISVTRSIDNIPGALQVQAVIQSQSTPMQQAGQSTGKQLLQPNQSCVLIRNIGSCQGLAQILVLGIVPFTSPAVSFSSSITLTIATGG